MNRTRAIALSGLTMLTMHAAAPASAAVECKGRLQYNSAANGWISTPYCGDNLIAEVARQNGMNVSGHEVRQNPYRKEEACRFAGSDIRVRDLCAGHLPEDQNGGGKQ